MATRHLVTPLGDSGQRTRVSSSGSSMLGLLRRLDEETKLRSEEES